MDACETIEKTVETPAPARPLRIGVLVGGVDRFENWQLRVFDRLAGDPRFSLVSFLVHPDAFDGQEASLFFRVSSALERRAIAREKSFRPSRFDMSRMRVDPLASADFPGLLHERQTERLVQSLELDLVIRLVPAPLPGCVLSRLPLGEWAFSFSDEQSRVAEWSTYGNVMASADSTCLRLYRRCGRAGREVTVATASFNVKFSAARTAGFVKERAVTLLMRELARLADKGEAGTRDDFLPGHQSHPPSAGDLLHYAGRLSGRLAGRAIKNLKAKAGMSTAVWTLYAGRGDIESFDPAKAIEIPPSPNEIRADPFLIEYRDETYVFYEAYAPGDKKAHIAVGRLADGVLTPLGVALEKEHHLSYPFVFEHEGEVYMMPEMNQGRRIEIWRSVEFPLRWELYSTALDGVSAADSSLVRHEGRWWLFTNLSDFHSYEDHCSELHVFEVDGPALGKVVPHRYNPVVIDSTTARNGGRMFSVDGKLFRPSQRNERGIYGYGLNIMQIDQLDLENYAERCVRVVRPDFKPGLVACHHFDATSGGMFIMDARLSG